MPRPGQVYYCDHFKMIFIVLEVYQHSKLVSVEYRNDLFTLLPLEYFTEYDIYAYIGEL